jgi:endonuclease/exonuclease/phosphatase family metal-dependent hydrolase
MQSIRLLSYNIHKGFTPGNSDFILHKIREAIRELETDIVCLQEVVGAHSGHQQRIDDWHDGGQFEFLADSIWPHFAYGKNAIYQQGHHGNAILSKYPFSYWENRDISRWKFSQRGILHGRIGSNLHLLCIHFGFLPIEQRFQLNQLKEMVHNQIPLTDGLIIAGDFNDWHHQIHRVLTRELHLQEAISHKSNRPKATYPASRPWLAMDRIYYRNVKLESASTLNHRHWQRLSDHCPVIADFSLTSRISSHAM